MIAGGGEKALHTRANDWPQLILTYAVMTQVGGAHL